ncbi:unnamed protein product [Oikopleura dioica]|uniref:Uncharacterized protein n=1 Tax=Oikopleura dioica TaxID=34765 RepID=E4XH60_OIKDI|nr:unnamed protein product [Oikopleura dioica]
MRLFFTLIFQIANAGLKDETVHKDIGVNGGEIELKNGAKVIIEKQDIVDRKSFSFAVIPAGTVYEDKLQTAQGEEYLAQSFTFSNGLVRRAMTSPIVLQKSTRNKNFDPLGSATTGNSSKVWNYHNETEAVGEYMTDYYLLKPQRNFHRPITVILPVKHELKSNYTYHVFVVSQEFSHHAPELSTEHVEHFFVEGWGFINSKEGSLELSGGFLKFETAIGGLFVAAQFRTENECHPASTFERKQRRHFRRHNVATFGRGLALAPAKDAEAKKFLAAYTRKEPLPEKRHYEQATGFFG